MKIVQCINVSKQYKHQQVLSNVSFTLKENTTILLLGHNGSGKSTLLKGIAGLITVDGAIHSTFEHVCYVPEKMGFPEFITVIDFLDIIGRVHQIPTLERKKRIHQLILDFEMNEFLQKRLSRLSKGMAQKVLLAQAFMQDADLYLLDEVMNGLDTFMQRKWLQLLDYKKKQGCSFFITTHYKEHYEGECDDRIVLEEGRIV